MKPANKSLHHSYQDTAITYKNYSWLSIKIFFIQSHMISTNGFFSFDFGTKTNFTAYKLEGIKALRNFKIKWDFLRATVKFWDTNGHVFWFKTTKL